MQISGWGRYPVVDAQVLTPVSRDALQSALRANAGRPLIARGMGRSYGDSSLAATVVNLRPLDLLLDFDPHSGVLRCDAGVTLAQILAVFAPRGWFLPVTPGTKFVTVGGAIASDVHGKNHHKVGCFSQFVDSFVLAGSDGTLTHCSPAGTPEQFRATCGGMGLTGIIVEATLRLLRIGGTGIEQTTYKAKCLDEALELFQRLDGATYTMAWIDCLATGASLGRSLVMAGEHANDGNFAMQGKSPLAVPVDMPGMLLNSHSIRAFNFLYYHRVRQARSTQRVHYDPFFYPLDAIHQWNRMYGKRGFTQYQFVIPIAAGREGLTRILQRIADSKRGSFLAVLKAFGPGNDNHLSFPMQGLTLALDFGVEPGLFGLLDELDAMVLDYGGRVYLTKDARVSAASFRQGYPRWQAMQTLRERTGARGVFSSLQSRRLELD